MSQGVEELKKDYAQLLRNPESLEMMGLADPRALQPERPFDGHDINRAFSLARMGSILAAAVSKDKPLELSAEFRARVIESGGNDQIGLDTYEKELLRGIGLAGIKIPMPYLIRDFPLSFPFNAAAVPRPAGALILVNRGLTDMIWFSAMLFSMTVRIAVGEGSDVTEKIERMPFDDATVVKWLAEVILAYLLKQNAHQASRKLPTFGRARTMFVACLLNESTKFVLAHEFAHLVKGHLNKDRPKDRNDLLNRFLLQVLLNLEKDPGTVRRTRNRSELIADLWAQEIEADLLGADMLFSTLGSPSSNGGVTVDSSHPLFDFVSAAPFFVLAVYDIISKVEVARGGAVGKLLLTDHPPVEIRRFHLEAMLKGRGFNGLPRHAKVFHKWFEGIAPQVVNSAMELSN